jgi:precorrin-6Y C5,15-methyltransferase (decarboxylating)
MIPWLAIVGLNEDGLAGLTAAARAWVDAAEVLVGDRRLLAMIPEDSRPRLCWPNPLQAVLPEIEQRRGRAVCVLASGDPLHFGIGDLLTRHFPIGEMSIHPAASAFTLACARLGWSRSTVETLSVHNRPIDALTAYLQPGAKLLVLTRNGRTPGEVAAMLRAQGWGASWLTVLERMGGAGECMLCATAADWSLESVHDLNTLAIDCIADPDAMPLSRVPGLPDQVFRNDGLLTKREVRVATLSALAPMAGQVLWDVGAGSGAIGIEWLRATPRGRVFAIESDETRRGLIAANARALGVPDLTVVAGEAPAALRGLAQPDAIFIGGGLTTPGLVEACWQALPSGGRLVANAVTIDGEAVILAQQAKVGGDLTRIAVWRGGPVGGMTGWKPMMPVTQWSVAKP